MIRGTLPMTRRAHAQRPPHGRLRSNASRFPYRPFTWGESARANVQILCFPEEFAPGYRLGPHVVVALDPEFLERALARITAAKCEH